MVRVKIIDDKSYFKSLALFSNLARVRRILSYLLILFILLFFLFRVEIIKFLQGWIVISILLQVIIAIFLFKFGSRLIKDRNNKLLEIELDQIQVKNTKKSILQSITIDDQTKISIKIDMDPYFLSEKQIDYKNFIFIQKANQSFKFYFILDSYFMKEKLKELEGECGKERSFSTLNFNHYFLYL